MGSSLHGCDAKGTTLMPINPCPPVSYHYALRGAGVGL